MTPPLVPPFKPEGARLGNMTMNKAGEILPTRSGQQSPIQETSTQETPTQENLFQGTLDQAGLAGKPSQEGVQSAIDAENAFLSRENLESLAIDTLGWLKDSLTSLDLLIQIGILLGALLPAVIFGPRLKKFLEARLVPLMPIAILKLSLIHI